MKNKIILALALMFISSFTYTLNAGTTPIMIPIDTSSREDETYNLCEAKVKIMKKEKDTNNREYKICKQYLEDNKMSSLEKILMIILIVLTIGGLLFAVGIIIKDIFF